MRTLRNEWFGDWDVVAYDEKADRTTEFLDRYGEYRVVEGVLYYESNNPRPLPERGQRNMVVVQTASGGIVELGPLGNRVKLIIPPEEPPTPVLDMAKKLGAERARANRYEKALREIQTSQRQCDWKTIAAYRKKLAREALDEPDSD